jgi:hypothetical protein
MRVRNGRGNDQALNMTMPSSVNRSKQHLGRRAVQRSEEDKHGGSGIRKSLS